MILAAAYDKIIYVTEPAGKRKEVILPFPVWTSMVNELEALKEKTLDQFLDKL